MYGLFNYISDANVKTIDPIELISIIKKKIVVQMWQSVIYYLYIIKASV